MQRKGRAAQPSGGGSVPSVSEAGGGPGSFDASVELSGVQSPINLGLGGTKGGSVYGVHGSDATAVSSLESRLRQLELQFASGGGGGDDGGAAGAKSQGEPITLHQVLVRICSSVPIEVLRFEQKLL